MPHTSEHDHLESQARAECQCHRLDCQDGKYVGAGITSYGSKLTEKLCSRSGIQTTTTGPRLTENPNRPCSITNNQEFEVNGWPDQHQVTQRLITPPSGFHNLLDSDDHCAGLFAPPAQGGFLQSIFSLALPVDQPDRLPRTHPSSGIIEASQPNDDVDEPEGLEEIQTAAIGFLSLDRTTESNGLPFILQAYATWLFHFKFEPLRIIHMARNDTLRNYVLGEERRQIMTLMAQNIYEITRSAAYNPVQSSSFLMTQTILRRRLTEARTCVGTLDGLDRQHAINAMSFTNQWISLMSKVGSLSSLLDFMQLVAPVFRRACPDPLEGLVNLPTLFATLDVNLQHYSTADVLLGVLTGRPMFFRYTTHFTPEVPESSFFLVETYGMRWIYGAPDRLIMTFAQMNALFEDFGPHVPAQVIDELEQGIKCMKPIIAPSTDSVVAVGRMVVQECWFMAALIYLYMGLCGDNSTAIRVANVRTRFMKLLVSVRPRRNLDSFLVLPLTILGVATNDWDERDIIRRRMLGVSECTHPGRMGNDLVRILDNVWSKRHPAVWGDLRQACWEVTGV